MMTSRADVPYADLESMAELTEECRCVEAECTAHGVDLHGRQRLDATEPPRPAMMGPVVIGEAAGHLVDDLPDYGC